MNADAERRIAEHEVRGAHYHRLAVAEQEMVDLGDAATEHVRAFAESCRRYRQVRSDAAAAATAVGIQRELDWRLDVDVEVLVRSIADEVLQP